MKRVFEEFEDESGTVTRYRRHADMQKGGKAMLTMPIVTLRRMAMNESVQWFSNYFTGHSARLP